MRRLMLCALLVASCNNDAAKDKEIAALRAQLAEKNSPPTTAPSLGAVQAQPQAAAPQAEASDGFVPRLLAAPTLADALRLTLPITEDSREEQSKGTIALAVWASKHMKWADVGVAKNETSVAKIMKDSDEARGKRMCVSGDIIQIAKERGIDRMYAGLLGGYYGQGIISYIAAGDTGDLVANSAAKFCGVVTGRYTYANSGGGTSHAVSMVGMFDLPENNPNKRRKVAANDDE